MNRPILITGMFFLVIYLLAILSQIQNDFWTWSGTFISSQIITNEESSFAEITSAILWLLATLKFIQLVTISKPEDTSVRCTLWLVFFVALCLFAFGEEISWGDHLFNYSTTMKNPGINYQRETNLHNLNLARLLDLKKDNVLFPYLQNATSLLNPLFYLLVFVIWVILPFLKRFELHSRISWIRDLPATSSNYQLLFIAQLAIYLVIDKSWFNVGHIFEFYVAFASLLAALDIETSVLKKPAAFDNTE